MNTLVFAGIQGEIMETSPNGNYVTVKLSERVTIIGTFSNEYNWEEIPEADSGFISFITYIGTTGKFNELNVIYQFIEDNGGYFRHRDHLPRPAKRVDYPQEIKVRGLTPEVVIELLNFFDCANVA